MELMGKALVTGGTHNDIDAMATLAINIQDKSPHIVDTLVIYHDGICDDLQKKIKGIMPTIFVQYKMPISKLLAWRNKTIRYFSPMVFCKYECFRLLERFDVVVWSDYDVVIKGSLNEFCEFDEQLMNIVESFFEIPVVWRTSTMNISKSSNESLARRFPATMMAIPMYHLLKI